VVQTIRADVAEESPETLMSGIVGRGEAYLPAEGLLAGHTHRDEMRDVAAGSVASPQDVAVKKEIPALLQAIIEGEGTVHAEKGPVGIRGEGGDPVDDLGESGAAITAAVAVAHSLDVLDNDTGIGVAAAVGAAAASIKSIVTGGEGEDMKISRYVP